MIKIYDINEMSLSEILPRTDEDTLKVEEIVRDIIWDVRKNGDKALFAYCEKFDGVKLSSLKVTEEEIEEAISKTDNEFLEILKEAKENIEAFHKLQKRSNFIKNDKDGVVTYVKSYNEKFGDHKYPLYSGDAARVSLGIYEILSKAK